MNRAYFLSNYALTNIMVRDGNHEITPEDEEIVVMMKRDGFAFSNDEEMT